MDKKFNIFWLTGMSGSGKSTLARSVKKRCIEKGHNAIIIDGDDIRDKDNKKLGFGYKDVLKNNLRIAQISLEQKKHGFSVVIVPVISPYDDVRLQVQELLYPYLHLIYIKAELEVLKYRDTKGLYLAADKGYIDDLIGYSDNNPYEEPNNPSIVIDTGRNTTLQKSTDRVIDFVDNILV
jgi:adenylylsulfate kinase